MHEERKEILLVFIKLFPFKILVIKMCWAMVMMLWWCKQNIPAEEYKDAFGIGGTDKKNSCEL